MGIREATKIVQDDQESNFGLEIPVFSVSSSSADNRLNEDEIEVDTEREFEEESRDETEFNENFLQIIRRITTEVSISDRRAFKTESTWEDSTHVSMPESREQLDNRARQYILSNYGGWGDMKGTILGAHGHIYEESKCLKIKIPEHVGFCRSDRNCPSNESCKQNECVNPCTVPSSPCHLLQECHVMNHTPKCKCKEGNGYVSDAQGQCIKARQERKPAGHCLPHQYCKAGDCCALGSSCNTCPNGFVVNHRECWGKGNRRCNEDY